MSKKTNSNRRDFLTGTWAADNPANRQPDPATLKPPQKRSNSHLECYSKNAMACHFELMFNMHQYDAAAEMALSAFRLIDEFEEQMTIYRESSEVSFINREAFNGALDLETNLYDLLCLAQTISQRTDGAFDITSHPLSDIWGFSRRSGQVPQQHEIDKTLERVSYHHLQIADRQIRFLKQGVKINLGGIGKGFALDHAAQKIRQAKIEDFVFHGGQSSVIAFGNNIGTEPESGWNIGLSDPIKPNKRIGNLVLRDQALGTSGTGRQGFFYHGKRYGHIIDPRTGFPTDHFLSTTVVAPTAAIADALATAFFVMPIEQIQSYCDKSPEIGTIVVVNSYPQLPRIETFNLSKEAFALN